MDDKHYSRFASSDLILRDELAIDRTLLANERTLLAYLRSGVALLIAGVSIVHFLSEGWFWMVGLMCVPAGITTGIIGIVRYRRMNHRISSVRTRSLSRRNHPNEDAEPSAAEDAQKAARL
jgi:putative membrane protein